MADYTQKIRDYITRFINKNENEDTTHSCCINVLSKEVSLLYINLSQNTPEIILAEKNALDDQQNSLEEKLSLLIKMHNLTNVPATWLLTPDDYQLFMIESMPVHPDEFKSALTWRLRSLISYPIEEATIDYFMLPAKKSDKDRPMIAAIITRQSTIQSKLDVFCKIGINMKKITIPEIAMRNLTSLHEDDEKSTAFIYFFSKTAILNITREKTIYFTRHINLPNDLMNKTSIEAFSLDIMRYFDYFQSQWRFPTPTRIYIGSDTFNVDELVRMLSESLLSKPTAFNLDDVILNNSQAQLISSLYVLPFGCLLEGSN